MKVVTMQDLSGSPEELDFLLTALQQRVQELVETWVKAAKGWNKPR